MLQAKFHGNQVFGSREEEILKGVYGHRGWPFYPDFMNKRSLPLSKEAQHKIRLF